MERKKRKIFFNLNLFFGNQEGRMVSPFGKAGKRKDRRSLAVARPPA